MHDRKVEQGEIMGEHSQMNEVLRWTKVGQRWARKVEGNVLMGMESCRHLSADLDVLGNPSCSYFGESGGRGGVKWEYIFLPALESLLFSPWGLTPNVLRILSCGSPLGAGTLLSWQRIYGSKAGPVEAFSSPRSSWLFFWWLLPSNQVMGLGGVAGPVVCPPHTRWDAGNRVVFQTIYSQLLLNRPRGIHIQTHIPVHWEDKTGPSYTLLALNYLHQCPSHCFLMP